MDAADRIYIDRRVHVRGGEPLRGDVRLPALPGVDPVRDRAPDVIGSALARDRAWIFGSGVLGFAGGAMSSTGVALSRILRGGLGMVAGAAGAVLVSAAVAKLRGIDAATGGLDDRRLAADAISKPPATDAAAPPERLRVLNWNVRELIGPDGTVRDGDDALEAIATVVRNERPDVLVLQEVAIGSPLSEHSDNLEQLAAKLGATDAVLVPNGVRVSGKEKGGAVLVFGDHHIDDARGLRHPDRHGSGPLRRAISILGPLEHVGIDLPPALSKTYMPRTTADVMVSTAGGHHVRVLGVHLSGTGSRTGGTPGSSDAQRDQLGPLVQTLDAWSGPTILAGDFNVSAGNRFHAFEQALLGSGGMRQAAMAPDAFTFPATGPRRQIDRIYHSEQVTPTGEARVLSTGAAPQGSDHLPVVVDVTVD